MHVTPEDIVDSFESDGDGLERLVEALVREEASWGGWRQDLIDWDHLTSQADGGRDLVVHDACGRSRCDRMPPGCSVWSAKSGKDGKSPTEFANEVQGPGRARLQQMLSHDGYSFVWCVAANVSQTQREALRSKASQLAQQLGRDAGAIRLCFADALADWVNSAPVVMARFFPQRWASWPCSTLEEWAGRSDHRHPMADVQSQNEVRTRVVEHLTAVEGPPLLHVAGLSGVGKTRAVLEACKSICAPSQWRPGILYFASRAGFGLPLLNRLRRSRQCMTRAVVDEVTLDEWSELQDLLGDCGDRLRVVTIGPAPRRASSRSDIVILAEPAATGVAAVARAVDPFMLEADATRLAEESWHDLHLARMLAEAQVRHPRLRKATIDGLDEVWNRVCKLFTGEISHARDFRDRYFVLAICRDIGWSGDYRVELEFLAQEYGLSPDVLDRTLRTADDCGLGVIGGRFFEAGPRALAVRTVETDADARLEDRVTGMVQRMPTDRMRKSLMRRAEELRSPALREVLRAALAAWFRIAFPSGRLALVEGGEPSRVLAAYTELMPEDGLRWLSEAVADASASELLSLSGGPDGRGGWQGRRQIVWLCQNLAQFSEHFRACEEILFRLALHETEHGIENNSREAWTGLFLPVLSWTEVPYTEREAILLSRLGAGDPEQVRLVMEAVARIVDDRPLRMGLPTVVGGRPVPDEWRPATVQELLALRKHTAVAALERVAGLGPDQQSAARAVVIEHLADFVDAGALPQLREWLVPESLDENELLDLRQAVDECLEVEAARRERAAEGFAGAEGLGDWQAALQPRTPEDRVRDAVGRPGWRRGEPGGRQATVGWFAALADDVLSAGVDWTHLFGCVEAGEPDAVSALGEGLGRADNGRALLPQVLELMREARLTSFAASYLRGVFAREGRLPAEVVEALDGIAESRPGVVACVTAAADRTEAGFERLLRVAPRGGEDALVALWSLGLGEWSGLLSSERQTRALRAVLDLAQEGTTRAVQPGLDVVQMWYLDTDGIHDGDLAEATEALLRYALTAGPVRDWTWAHVVMLLPDSMAASKAALLAEAAMGPTREGWALSEEALEALRKLAADHPDEAMAAVGPYLLRPVHERRLYQAHGLFEAIGLDSVRRWLDGRDEEQRRMAAIAMAEHLDSPDMSGETAHIPPVTEWLVFEEYAGEDDVFHTFLRRRDLKTRIVPDAAAVEDLKRRLAPFLADPRPRVREWAEHEINVAQRWSDLSAQEDAEDGRL